MKKCVITVVGKDTVGIIAKVCTFLADKNVNILEITQSIVGDFFNMMAIADFENANVPFGDIVSGLSELGKNIGVEILCQNEEIFQKMHRL